MWKRWKEGWTLHQIAQLFNRFHSSVHRILAETGGIRPPQRRRSRLALTLAEREEISRALVIGHSIRAIAARIGRAPSTVSREIDRNGGQAGYRANQADCAAWDRAHRPKRCKLAQNRSLAGIVADKLRLLWSPEQIAGWLKHTYPGQHSGKKPLLHANPSVRQRQFIWPKARTNCRASRRRPYPISSKSPSGIGSAQTTSSSTTSRWPIAFAAAWRRPSHVLPDAE